MHDARFLLALCLVACSSPRPGLEPHPRPAGDATPAAGLQATVRPADVPTPRGGPHAAQGSALPLDVFERQILEKQLTDIELYEQLGGEAIMRKVRYAAADGLEIPAYVFAPRDTTRRYPALIMVHGGIHGDFDAIHAPQVRDLVRQGYVIIAPEYRGSTGYGQAHYDAIDYGGEEVEDCIAAIDYLRARVPFADADRVGILGWSHGGFIALHAIFRKPDLFRAAVAHVPVTDLPTRIRTHSEGYHRLFYEQKGFGARLEENPTPYIERSPIAHARKLRTPLLVHAADNDDDVLIIENRNLRDSMVVAGNDLNGLYTYKEYHNPPGGHAFSVLPTPQGRESWAETVRFLNRYLSPEASAADASR